MFLSTSILSVQMQHTLYKVSFKVVNKPKIIRVQENTVFLLLEIFD